MEPRHQQAVDFAKSSNHLYLFNGRAVCYCEYGAGSEIITVSGYVVADFPSHLDAEVFLDMCVKIGNIKGEQK